LQWQKQSGEIQSEIRAVEEKERIALADVLYGQGLGKVILRTIKSEIKTTGAPIKVQDESLLMKTTAINTVFSESDVSDNFFIADITLK
jgi:hypothetical protein